MKPISPKTKMRLEVIFDRVLAGLIVMALYTAVQYFMEGK